MSESYEPAGHTRERAVLVAVGGKAAAADGMMRSDEDLLSELRALAVSAGAEVTGECVQHRNRADKRTFIGRGKVDEVRQMVVATDAEMVVFDNDLSPAQGKNLENTLEVRVIDRSELILDIFARRARSREAKLQVELAQLQYLLPRLRRMWTHLSRIRGGIGLRGPGETQLEVDRRSIGNRIAVLKRKLVQIEKRRKVQRKARAEAWNVALVGYTNVGKSTIMNRLAGTHRHAEDRLFATLDAATRRIVLQGGDAILLTDTVGFIRSLPHQLVASFRATLEEVVTADLLLHVVDVSDPRYADQMRVVEDVLRSLGVADTPVLYVFNKIDRIAAVERAGLRAELLAGYPGSVVASAVELRGLVALEEAIAVFVRGEELTARVTLPATETRTLAMLYENTNVVGRRYVDTSVEVDLRARREVIDRLRRDGVAVEVAS